MGRPPFGRQREVRCAAQGSHGRFYGQGGRRRCLTPGVGSQADARKRRASIPWARTLAHLRWTQRLASLQAEHSAALDADRRAHAEALAAARVEAGSTQAELQLQKEGRERLEERLSRAGASVAEALRQQAEGDGGGDEGDDAVGGGGGDAWQPAEAGAAAALESGDADRIVGGLEVRALF
jgi:hypothetical protein